MRRLFMVFGLAGWIVLALGPSPAEAQVASRLPEFDQVASSSGPVTMGELWHADSKVYFFSEPRSGPQRPWVTDGTREGTRLVSTYCPAGRCSKLRRFSAR